jgi:hypothetical protein
MQGAGPSGWRHAATPLVPSTDEVTRDGLIHAAEHGVDHAAEHRVVYPAAEHRVDHSATHRHGITDANCPRIADRHRVTHADRRGRLAHVFRDLLRADRQP